MQKRKGITLIVLVITIIVIIILSGAVILGLANTNIFTNANKDKYLEEIVVYKNSLKLYHSNKSLESPHEYNMENINASGEEMKKYITEMQEKDYNKFKIRKGELVYIGENDKEIEWSSGVIPVEALSFDLSDRIVDTRNIEITLKLSGKIAQIGKSKEVEVFLTEHKRGAIENNSNQEKLFSTSKKGTISSTGNSIIFTFNNLKHDIVYLVTAKAKVDGKEYKTSESEIIYTALGSEFNKPTINIDWDKKPVKEKIIAYVTLIDNDSGIDKSKSKYIFDSNSGNYNENDSIWNDRNKTNNFVNVDFDSSKSKFNVFLDKPKNDGIYYLHVLSVDKFNNKVSTTSTGFLYDTIPPDIDNVLVTVFPKTPAKSVKVTITKNSEDIEKIVYKLPGSSELKEYNNPFEVSRNGKIEVYAEDKAGNRSNVKEVSISNIDKLPPKSDNPFSPESANNVKSVTVNISVKDNDSTAEDASSGIKEIKYLWSNSKTKLASDDKLWNNASKVNNNGNLTKSGITETVYLHIRAEDAAGNVRTYVSGSYNIDNTAPDITNIDIKLNPNGYTNQDIIATISGISNDAIIKQYKSPDELNWTDCDNGTKITITKNGNINIRVVDATGNENTKTVSVDKIDKLMPSVILNPNSQLNITKIVTVNISATDKNATKEYCKSDIESIKYQWSASNADINVNDKNWKIVKNNSNVTLNNETGDRYLHVLVKDRAGNILNYVSGKYSVDNTAPDISNLKIILTPTSFARKATVRIEGKTSDMASIEYTMPGSEVFNKYNGEFEITRNGKIKVRAKDAIGNINSTYKELNVTNIDKLNPTSIVLNPNSRNNIKSVTVNVKGIDAASTSEDASSGIGTIKYQWKTDSTLLGINDNSWNNASTINAGEGNITLNSITGTRYLHVLVIDRAGNRKTAVSGEYTLDNIAPSISNINVTLNPNGYTNQNVTATVNGISSDSVIKQYTSPDKKDWTNCSNGTQFEITKNGTINIKVVDSSDNQDIKAFRVDKIDKLMPSVVVTPNYQSKVSKSVTVRISASDALATADYCKSDIESVKYQWRTSNVKVSENDGGWKTINNNSYVTLNNVNGLRYLHVLVKDKAGNVLNYVSGSYNMDNTAPSISNIILTLEPNTYTNKDITATINGISSDAVERKYTSPDQTSWTNCDNGTKFTVSKNGTINIKVVDEAGNEDVKVFSVDKIDKLMPIVSLSPNSNLNASRSVTVKISVNDALATKDYCKSDIESIKYQWRTTNAKVSENDNNWIQINNNTNVTINNITGDRYLHVLTKDRAGNVLNYVSGKYVIDNTAPSISNLKIVLTPTTFTRNATVRIDGKTPDISVIEYTMPGSETWNIYNGEFGISRNGKIKVRAKDSLGNVTNDIKELNVTNIDKLNPSSITFDPNSTINKKSVNVSIKADDAIATAADASSGIQMIKYQWKTTNTILSVDDVSWNSANQISSSMGSVGMTSITGTRYLHVLAIDKAGNKKTAVSGAYTLDNTPPSISNITVTLNPNGYTNQNVTATINGISSDAIIRKYTSPDQLQEKDCNNGTQFTVTKNGNITVKVIDAAGNESKKTVNVGNIDKLIPKVSLSPDSQLNASKSVSVKITASDQNATSLYCKSDIKRIKYQWRTTNTKVSTSDSGWIAVNNNSYVSLNNVTGDRYLHVLVEDNAGNILNYVSGGKYVVDSTPPDISSLRIILTPTSYTKEAIAEITGQTSDMSIVEYQLPGSTTWYTYNGKFRVTRNGKISARAKDALGNVTTQLRELNVTNIDKLNPTSITLSPNSSYNSKNVNVNIKAVDANATSEYANSGIQMIKYQWRTSNTLLNENDSSWNNASTIYSSSGNVTLNSITGIRYLHVLAVDNAGNKKVTVSSSYNIDNTAPSMNSISISINPTYYTRQATVTISGKTSDMNVLEYTLPGESSFRTYSSPFTVTQNGIIRVRSKDIAQNISSEKTYNVTNIDRQGPTAPKLTNTSNGVPTRSDVTITLTSSDNLSGISRYEWKNGNSWVTTSMTTDTSGVGKITFNTEMNQYISFRAVDKVGNISQESTTKVNIDRTAPDISNIKFTLNPSGYTNQNPSVTITGFPADAVNREYSIGGGSWYPYSTAFTISSNCILYARARDEAGNEASTSYQVTTIDKTPPTINNFNYSTTQNSITVSSVSCSDNIGVKYYIFTTNTGLNSGKITNSSYTFTSLSSGTTYTVQVTVCDAAGNTRSLTKNIRTKKIYTISYNANNGSGAPSSQSQIEGSSVRLSSTKPTRSGYTFEGWNTNSSGTGTTYTPGNSYTFTSSITLYAKWKQSKVPAGDKVKVGDYVDCNINGNSSWRVLYNGTEGYGIQLISTGSVSQYTLSGKYDYADSISLLNGETSSYENSSYVVEARCVGSNPSNPSSYASISASRVRFYENGGLFMDQSDFNQSFYQTDINQMNGTTIQNIGESYFLAARNCFLWNRYSMYYINFVDASGVLQNDHGAELFRVHMDNRESGDSFRAGIRPCIKLVSNVYITGGTGTSSDPYRLSL